MMYYTKCFGIYILVKEKKISENNGESCGSKAHTIHTVAEKRYVISNVIFIQPTLT